VHAWRSISSAYILSREILAATNICHAKRQGAAHRPRPAHGKAGFGIVPLKNRALPTIPSPAAQEWLHIRIFHPHVPPSRPPAHRVGMSPRNFRSPLQAKLPETVPVDLPAEATSPPRLSAFSRATIAPCREVSGSRGLSRCRVLSANSLSDTLEVCPSALPPKVRSVALAEPVPAELSRKKVPTLRRNSFTCKQEVGCWLRKPARGIRSVGAIADPAMAGCLCEPCLRKLAGPQRVTHFLHQGH